MTENYVKERVEKEQKEYSVKNLMALRRVCVQFDEVIDCKMMPGLDYDPIMIDVKIQVKLKEDDGKLQFLPFFSLLFEKPRFQ